ncbi:3-hydroxyacyl-CoA dehydrogenase family protein [Tumebacillus flagellatus]|uniref:3-hydroxybutyryl-CoA dehydrogenase n=1 Tax=Tumebacillus flagellatus TaxID=1157490 RepID=A0A074LQ98_9BACL|nr:3-hydroxyacyl-CoA dehydrogenase NAD-binding domain-containing protein [Tumebacillus flagellatus]KEO84326.1 3-hydroxybutyryl-CoA dehydrogenase [Tumebacillus flagellatus]
MNVQKVGIVGAGTMGQGLAAAIAGKGIDVILLDRSEQELERAKLGLELSLDHRLAKWGITEAEKKSILSRIVLGTNLSLLRDCEVVIETIWENLEEKTDLLLAIEQEVGPEALVASNTSTLSITELAVQTAHPERVIGLHFHFPVEQRNLVEVVRGLKTSERTAEAAFRFLEGLGKQAVQVFESPGFITTRLMLPLINEAVLIYAEGVATAEDIDKAMKHGYGFHIGPLELADRFGLDAVVDMLDALFHETMEPRYRPAAYLRKLVRGGQLGTKARQGFFQYDEWGERV